MKLHSPISISDYSVEMEKILTSLTQELPVLNTIIKERFIKVRKIEDAWRDT